jgi:predicted transcriptional regulator
MQDGAMIAVLDEILEPVTNAFSHDVAQALVNIKAGEAAQARIADLADKCNEGRLTTEEEVEYSSLPPRLGMFPRKDAAGEGADRHMRSSSAKASEDRGRMCSPSCGIQRLRRGFGCRGGLFTVL